MGGTGPTAASHIPCYREKQLQLATRDMLQMTPRGGHPAIQRLALSCCMGEKAIVSSKWINDQTICCLHHESATFTDATADFKRLHLT